MNSSKNSDFLMFLPFRESGRIPISRCQGIAVKDYGVTLGALALKPSRFCNDGIDHNFNILNDIW